MSIYTPYTYLIGWTKSNKYYYGVRYAQGCHPNDLWNSYFTSSKHVQRYYEKHGEPDIIQIRKTFDNPNKARLWEHKVLLRINAKDHKDFLNHSNNFAPEVVEFDRIDNLGLFSRKGKGSRGTYEEMYGEKKSEELKKNKREQLKGNTFGKNRKTTDKSRKRYSDAAKKKHNDLEYKKKHSESVKKSWEKRKDRVVNNHKVSCIICKKETNLSSLSRWHKHL